VPSPSVELILARNLISSIALAAFIVDPDGVVSFFNDAAGELIGRRFEEVGRLDREEWNSSFGPFDQFGELVPTDDLPLTVALREGLPANGRFHVRVHEGPLVEVDVSALPLVGIDGFAGAVVAFWRTDHDGPDDDG
jgi:PAS domain-containing protein